MIAVTTIAFTSTWRDHAECRGVDPGIFHPDDEEENDFSAEAAKAICSECPVREACLEHAITVREKHGVWGGLTARERRRLIRRRRRSA
jgi:WhiB family redox-sensing transcriptional regulator